MSLERKPFGLYYPSSRVENAQKYTDLFIFHIKIHEISPGAVQKSNGLKVTCLMSLYFKSEDDTMKNEIPAAIFSEIFLAPPPPPIFIF